MAYKSDVRIVTSKKGYNELINYIQKYYKKNNIPIEHQFVLINNLKINYENKFQKYFGWNNIRWYGYPDVEAIEKGLEYLKEKDYSYRFARMGDDSTDYEEHYHESTREKEKGLEFPTMERYFDDDLTFTIIKNQARCISEVERE